MIVTPLSILISPMREETEHICTTDTVFNENRNIAMFIVLFLEFVFMLLTAVFYFSAMCSLKRNYMIMSKSTVSNTILENRQTKFSKSMISVSILLLVMLILSGPFLMRNLLEMIQPVSRQVLLITFVLTNVNSLLNPLIYFINIEEFKVVLKRLCFKSSATGNATDDNV